MKSNSISLGLEVKCWGSISWYALCAGNEEVRITVLAALGSWLARAGESIPADCAIFFSAGLKEKETLRRAHLRCLRQALKNQDLVNKVSLSYFSPIIGTSCFFIFTIAHFWLPFSHVFQMQLTWIASHANEYHLALGKEKTKFSRIVTVFRFKNWWSHWYNWWRVVLQNRLNE